jgi:Zn-finger nucleic acid-binding protein
MAAGGSAESLTCPTCGAPASPEATSCPFCGVALALVSCPKCLGRIFKGAKHCSHCGEAAPEAQSSAPLSLKCPRCGTNLLSVTVGTAALGECDRCGGTWVDGRTFERIVAEKEEQSLVLAAALPGFGVKRAARPHADRYWPCPVCHNLMNRVNFAHISGVVLDACRTHGVWFDEDELRQLVEFIRSGGLEKARAEGKAERERTRSAPLHQETHLTYTIPDDESHEWMGVVVKGAIHVLDWLVRR